MPKACPGSGGPWDPTHLNFVIKKIILKLIIEIVVIYMIILFDNDGSRSLLGLEYLSFAKIR